MLFPSASANNRTSGPKGYKDDNVYAGDKSPAYPEVEFFPQTRTEFSAGLERVYLAGAAGLAGVV
jgi:hypothetical protein